MPTYRVKDPKTGKTVRLTGESPPSEQELDEIFSKVSGKTEDSGIMGKIKSFADFVSPGNQVKTLGKALSLPSNIVGGSMKASREAVKGEYQPPKIGGDFTAPSGKTMNLGEVLPPSVVGAFRGVRDSTPVMSELPKTVGVSPESPAGLALGLTGEILTPDPLDFLPIAKAAGKITQKIGSKIDNAGEEMVLTGLRATKSQVKNFKKSTGEGLADFMKRNSITSDFVEKSQQKIDELQDAFDDIAIKSNRLVKNEDLYKSFMKRADELESSIIPQVKAKSSDVKDVFRNLINKHLPTLADDIKEGRMIGDASLTVGDLTRERKAIDKLLKETQFNMPVEQASYLKSVRDVLKESVEKATEDIDYKGIKLKQIGAELKKLYKFRDIADTQSGLGKGAMKPGLYDLLTAGIGFSQGESIPERLGNAALAAGARRIVSSPKVIGKVSTMLQKLGEKTTKSKTVPKALEFVLKGSKEGAIQSLNN